MGRAVSRTSIGAMVSLRAPLCVRGLNWVQMRDMSTGETKKTRDKSLFKAWERKLGNPSAGLPDFVEQWSRQKFYALGGIGVVAAAASVASWGVCFGSFAVVLPVGGYWWVGMHDIKQKHHTLLRNFPVLANFRYLLESIRPEMRQYFFESDNDSSPFNREQRSIVYARAKRMTDTLPFGTRRDVYQEGFEWVNHSIFPKHVKPENERVTVGGRDCKIPYSASRLNISAMSYGALSDRAILALNTAAKMGNFYHNTGEGGISRFHIQPGGDIVWNVGTGYFGCRCKKTGGFDPVQFQENASREQVKMIEIKLSQGAKPAHGGILPAAKVTEIIAEARGVQPFVECDSPPRHKAFSDARGLLHFVQQLRELSGGKPVGFKMCIGRPAEFASIVGAMVEQDIYPDFITIDGAEGGTGAAPPEFSNHIGFPLTDGLVFAHQTLIGAGAREHVKLIASGKMISGFSNVRTLALGADICNSARGMMFALGCIQALKCNTNKCPTGIATQDPELIEGLDVDTKAVRVFNFHQLTTRNVSEIVGAIGLDNPGELRPDHIMRKMAGGTYSKSYADIFPPLESGSLLSGAAADHPSNVQGMWDTGQKLLRGQPYKSIPLVF